MSDGNGQGVPTIGGFPLLSSPFEWAWECHEVGRHDDTGEKVYVLRLWLPTGPLDVWAPASFLRDMGEKLIAQAAGLHIAKPHD